GIFQPGFQLQALANPADRLIDFAIFILAEIEDIATIGGPFDRNHDRVDTVLNVEIGFALLAIAKHFELRRIRQQLLIEIKHVAGGVALAEHREEAEAEALKAEPLQQHENKPWGG